MLDPATGEEFARIARGDARDIDRAVAAARAASSGPWGRLTAAERGRSCRAWRAHPSRSEELAALEARDTGKPMGQARADIAVAARYFEFYGGAADKVHGDTIPFLNGYNVMVLREPHGVTGHIMPWNYPAQMFGRSLAPALAVGNAAVLKPAEEACLTPLALAELAHGGRLSRRRVNVVTGLGEEAGAALFGHPGIDFISFTGSPEVGTLVQKAAAERTPALRAGARRQVAADRLRRCRSGARRRRRPEGHRAERRADLLGRQPRAGPAIGLRRVHRQRSPSAFAHSVAGTPEMDLDCGPVINADQQRAGRGLHRARAQDSGMPMLAAGPDRRGRAAGRLLRGADAVRAGAARPCAGARRGVRPGARRDPLRRRGRRDRRSPTAPTTASSPASGPEWRAPDAHGQGACAPARSSSTATAPAAASSCPSAASSERPRPREGLHGAGGILRRQDRRPTTGSDDAVVPAGLYQSSSTWMYPSGMSDAPVLVRSGVVLFSVAMSMTNTSPVASMARWLQMIVCDLGAIGRESRVAAG